MTKGAMLCELVLHEVVESQPVDVFIAQNGGRPYDQRYLSFSMDAAVQYHSFCDDFGPMNLSSTVRFIKQLEQELAACAQSCCRQLVLSVESGPRPLTNAVMLLGSYLILMKDMTPEQVADRFAGIPPDQLEDYRDATYLPADFGLALRDCWDGLFQGQRCGWVRRPTDADSPLWGAIDIDEYEHYDAPHNADLHQVVPGKLVAMCGPHDLGGALYADDAARGTRRFSPAYLAGALRELGVSDVVQLNEEAYDTRALEEAGIAHHALVFPDCTEPPGPLVAAFLAVADAARGAVAVHCRAGLGRTGTLVAVWMMRSRGFTARAAMGWLRLVRPGSVIGAQQTFLCRVQSIREAHAAARRAGRPVPALPPAAALGVGGGSARLAAAAAAAAAAAQVSEALDRRAAARMRAGRAS
jgi:cell division cycle 14